MQTEGGIPAYRSLQDCLSTLQGGNFQEHHSSILQPQGSDLFTNRCLQEITRSCTTTEFYPGNVCFRALTGSEKNYQNLKRECLVTIWGMEKFHYFLYGKEFTVETDQKPLVSIYKKHMVEISPRIQRLVVGSFPYQPFHVSKVQERSGNSTGRCS